VSKSKEPPPYGMAWHYQEFSKAPELARAQELVKAKKLGLWQEKNPVPPWEFRKRGERGAGGEEVRVVAGADGLGSLL